MLRRRTKDDKRPTVSESRTPSRQVGTDGAQPSSRLALALETRIEVVKAACA
jgi:hypothetical protein